MEDTEEEVEWSCDGRPVGKKRYLGVGEVMGQFMGTETLRGACLRKTSYVWYPILAKLGFAVPNFKPAIKVSFRFSNGE